MLTRSRWAAGMAIRHLSSSVMAVSPWNITTKNHENPLAPTLGRNYRGVKENSGGKSGVARGRGKVVIRSLCSARNRRVGSWRSAASRSVGQPSKIVCHATATDAPPQRGLSALVHFQTMRLLHARRARVVAQPRRSSTATKSETTAIVLSAARATREYSERARAVFRAFRHVVPLCVA